MGGLPLTTAGVVSRLVGFIATRASPAYQQDVKARIAQVVTASDARTVEEAMQAIAAQVERDRGFRSLLARAGVGAAAAFGMNIQPIEETGR